MFDVTQFLDQTITEANSTQSTPVPPGEYIGVITEVKARQWTSKADPSRTGVTLDVTWQLDDPSLKELLGRDKITVRQGIMLDFTDSGQLDTGKGRNVQLGRLREAVGLNTPGQAFAFNMLHGRTAKVNVGHRVDGDQIFVDVKGVTRLA